MRSQIAFLPAVICLSIVVGGSSALGQSASGATKPAIANINACAPKHSDYPAESIRNNEQGTTRLRFHIGRENELTRVDIEKSSGFPRLDRIALEALSRCSFASARDKDGTPITSSFSIAYVWRLQ